MYGIENTNIINSSANIIITIIIIIVCCSYARTNYGTQIVPFKGTSRRGSNDDVIFDCFRSRHRHCWFLVCFGWLFSTSLSRYFLCDCCYFSELFCLSAHDGLYASREETFQGDSAVFLSPCDPEVPVEGENVVTDRSSLAGLQDDHCLLPVQVEFDIAMRWRI